MTYEEAKKKLETDPDFIYSKRFDYSLEKCIEKYPEGAPNKIIAQCLMLTEEEVDETYRNVVEKLRKIMKVEVEQAS